jgi:hypothetical protein
MSIAEAYYTSVGEKNIEALEKYLHADVQFIGPLEKKEGKKAVLEATKNFAAMIKDIKIRAKFSSDEQTMLVYDADFPAPIGNVRGASLMTFQNSLVIKIELFYDSHLVTQVKDKIF